MAIKVMATEDKTMLDLKSKMGDLGIEIVFDEDDLKADKDDNKKNNDKKINKKKN